MSELSYSYPIELLLTSRSYQGRIANQLRRLGGSYDWSREAFTMNEVHILLEIHSVSCNSLMHFSHSAKLSSKTFVVFTRMELFTVPTVSSTGVSS
jgi:hypothetical protein